MKQSNQMKSPNLNKQTKNQDLQEIGNGFNSGSLIDPNFVAPHNELLLIRQPILRQAPHPQPVRQRPGLRLHPGRHRAILRRHHRRRHPDRPAARRPESGDAAYPPARDDAGGPARKAALGQRVSPVQAIARKLQHFFLFFNKKESWVSMRRERGRSRVELKKQVVLN